MVGPQPFKISAPEGDYFVNFEIDMYSLSFPIVCHPYSLKREMIKYLEANNEKKDQVVNAMLIEKNEAMYTNDVLPLLATINYIPKSMDLPVEENSQDNIDQSIMQFRQFIDELSNKGELDYLSK